jgi:hypothetical protein
VTLRAARGDLLELTHLARRPSEVVASAIDSAHPADVPVDLIFIKIVDREES